MKKKGSIVTAQDDNGIPVTRNSSFFNSAPAAAEENSTTEIRKDPAYVTSPPGTSDALMQPDMPHYQDATCNVCEHVQ